MNFSVSRACAILGVDPDVDDETVVKQKWRRKALEVHPDKLQALQLQGNHSQSQAEQQKSTEQFHELQVALEISLAEVERRRDLASSGYAVQQGTSRPASSSKPGNVLAKPSQRPDGTQFNHFPVSGERYPWAAREDDSDATGQQSTNAKNQYYTQSSHSTGETRHKQGVNYSYYVESAAQKGGAAQQGGGIYAHDPSVGAYQGSTYGNAQEGSSTATSGFGTSAGSRPVSSRPVSGREGLTTKLPERPTSGSISNSGTSTMQIARTTSAGGAPEQQKPERYFRSDGTEIKKSEYLDKHYFGNAFGSDQLDFREFQPIPVSDSHSNLQIGHFQMVWRCLDCEPVSSSVCARLKPKKGMCICGHKLADHENCGGDGTAASLSSNKMLSLRDASGNATAALSENGEQAQPQQISHSCKKCPCRQFAYHVQQGAWEVRCECKHKRQDHKVYVFNNSCHGIIQQFRCCAHIPGSLPKKPCPCRNFKASWVCNCGHQWDRHVSELSYVPLPEKKPLFGREWVCGGLRVECREIAEERREKWVDRAVENAMMNAGQASSEDPILTAKRKAVNFANRNNLSEVAKARMQEGLDEVFNNPNGNMLLPDRADRKMKVVLKSRTGVGYRSKPQMDAKVGDGDVVKFGDIVVGHIFEHSGWFKCVDTGLFLPIRTPDGAKAVLEEVVVVNNGGGGEELQESISQIARVSYGAAMACTSCLSPALLLPNCST